MICFSKASRKLVTVVVPIIVGVVVAVVILTLSIYIFVKKTKERKPTNHASGSSELITVVLLILLL